jgi:Tc5 transposase DNA-binding domain/DDE superfamily endonuclease
MPHQPQSLKQRAKAKSDTKEENMGKAILAYRSFECGADGKRKSLRDLAKEYDVSPSALCRRVKVGAIGIVEFNKTKQSLSEGAERELASWALDLANRNLPLTNALLADKALRILQATNPLAKPLGDHWVNRFLIRHGDALRRHWSRPLDNIRSTSATAEAVNSYFDQYISLVGEDGSKIAPELQYAFDETGIQPSLFYSKRVIGSAQSSSAPTATATDRELTTYLPVISASGTLVMGLVIFKSKYLRQSFLGTKGNPHDLMYVLLLTDHIDTHAAYRVACSDKGYTNQIIGTQFVAKLDEKTKELANGRTRLLHVDGHNSHLSCDLLDNAVDSNIEILGYPPHMTHLLQGLDVVSFAILKRLFYDAATEFHATTGKEPKKDNIIDLLIEPIKGTFTPSNIEAAWRATGLRPIDRHIIPTQVLRSASPSVRPSAFPGTVLASPIANVVVAMRKQVQALNEPRFKLKFELDPQPKLHDYGPVIEWPQRLPDPLDMLSNQLGSLSIGNTSTIPQKSSAPAASILNSLQGTSASFLMHPETITSSDQLPPLPPYTGVRQIAAEIEALPQEPPSEAWDDFKRNFGDLARRNEQLEAKVVLQNMHLEAITLKLGDKEKPKEKGHPGRIPALKNNNILTRKEVIDHVRAAKDAALQKAVLKGQRAEQTVSNKEAAAWRKEATRRKKEKQAALNELYDEHCEEAKREGRRKPQKPKAIPREATPTKYKKSQKGKGPAIDEVEESEEEQEEQEEHSERSTGSDDDSYEEE